MKITLILEDRDAVFNVLSGFLMEVDPQLKILRFRKFEEFSHWFRLNFMAQPAPILPQPEPSEDENEAEGADKNVENIPLKKPLGLLEEGSEICLMITNHRILGAPHKALVVKLNEFLKCRELLPEGQDRMPVMLVVNETDDEFDLEECKETFIDNFLFKPFDRLVCKAKILWALYGKEAIGKLELYKEAPRSPVEMRKDIETLEISETGFRTLCGRELEEGLIAKYYSTEFFRNGEHDGVFAISHRKPLPSKHRQGQFEVQLKYLGIDSKQIRAVRGHIEKETGLPTKEEITSKTKAEPVGVVLLMEDRNEASQIKEQLEEAFGNINVKVFYNYYDFLLNVDPEFGANELIEQQSGIFEIEEVVFQYDFESGVFLSTTPAISGEHIYGIPRKQVSSLRAFLLSHLVPDDRIGLLEFWDRGNENSIFTMKLEEGKSTFMISLSDRQITQNGKQQLLTFKLRLSTFEEVTQYMVDRGDLPKPLGAVFLSERIADYRDHEFWSGVKSKMLGLGFHCNEQLAFFRVGASALKDYELINRVTFFETNFVQVVDKRFMGLKVKESVPQLKFQRERPLELKMEKKTVIQAGVVVTLKQINEVNLILIYNRPVDPGKYRHFSLWDPKTRQRKAFLAKCVDTEKDPDDKTRYLNYFLFFGLADQENSFLRNWMIDQYRISKNEKDKGA